MLQNQNHLPEILLLPQDPSAIPWEGQDPLLAGEGPEDVPDVKFHLHWLSRIRHSGQKVQGLWKEAEARVKVVDASLSLARGSQPQDPQARQCS